MPDIRDLLRDAAAGPSAPLDLDRVRSRARQRRVRRRAGLVGGAAVTMVVVLVAGGLFLRDNGDKSELVVGPSTTTAVPGPNPVEVPVTGASAVAVGRSSVWVGRGQGELVQLDPETFLQRSTAQVLAPVTDVAVGRSAVWATGRDPVELPQGMVSRNDIGTEGMANPNLLDTEFERAPGAIAMAPDDSVDESVWVIEPLQTQVLRIDPANNKVDQVQLGQKPSSAAVDESGLWVGTDGPLMRVDAKGSVQTAKVNASWVAVSRAGLYASSGTEVFLVDTAAVFESTSAATPLRGRGSSGQLAADPLGDGVWVADDSGVTYLREADGKLAAVEGRQLPGVVARDLVADGTYLWIVTDAGKLLRWRPPPG